MRTIGWAQDAGNIKSLKKLVSMLIPNSEENRLTIEDKIPRLITNSQWAEHFTSLLSEPEIRIEYGDLIGKGPLAGENRSTASCSGVGQMAFVAQNGREYQSNWSTNSFVTLAITLGLLDYDETNDTCKVSALGKKYALTDNGSLEEKTCLLEAILSYPPAVRILSLLNSGEGLTKFELGKQLGFVGEDGFGSIAQNLYVAAICEAQTSKEKQQIRNNMEGMCDKYARMICGWLESLDLVRKTSKDVSEIYAGKQYVLPQQTAYLITPKGTNALNQARGRSRHRRIKRIVYSGMLASKTKDADYSRARRATIIKYINVTERTIDEIHDYLISRSFNDSIECIVDDLKGLERIGLNVVVSGEKYKINDSIECLKIPELDSPVRTDIATLKDDIRQKLIHVDHAYLDIIDYAFNGKKNYEFEIRTVDLLTNELEFKGTHLGGSRRPDSIIYKDSNGAIIDNKAYKMGYSMPINQADEMTRYIEENKFRSEDINPNKWWEGFDLGVSKFYFLFVSSQFSGRLSEKLSQISNRTGISGAAVSASNLLLLAEKIKSGAISYAQSFEMMNCNSELIIQ